VENRSRCITAGEIHFLQLRVLEDCFFDFRLVKRRMVKGAVLKAKRQAEFVAGVET
jgi:hypothetical protein